jgi:hypothetical protein
MKKRLEAELLSIAHRILKLKNKSEVDQLYHETQKLYEALTVLKFYGDNYEQAKSEISLEDLEEKLSVSLEEKSTTFPIAADEPLTTVAIEDDVTTKSHENEKIETPTESIVVGEITLEEEEVVIKSNEDDFGAIFELAAESPQEIEDEKPEENLKQELIEEVKAETKQISFEELLGENYTEPVFVKPNEITKPVAKKEKSEKSEIVVDNEEEKPVSLNDKLSKSINIGLNDRIGFVKHLFGDSTEDYNRVLSQLNTFSSFEEANDFIEEIIKPDYNNWEGVEDYAERFIELVEKKFV